MIFGGMQKSSTIDFPGVISCVLFTRGCDMNCFYCHNRDLISRGGSCVSEAIIWDFLERRRGLLDGVVLSGGEPTLQR
ncbi:MAG: 4Fe-4S cluster-binding domain-containing protein, partial [Clostridia bacterium]|nr:4Fe-4S cluster-binding domain-containing protein [Clostridia bacterium]